MKPNTLPYQQGSSTGDIDRSSQIRRDNDNVKVPKIGIYDVDYAIFFHLQENLKPQVVENGSSISVPVQFANGEKWAQIRSQGYLRDVNKKVLAPIMVLRRVDVSSDDRLPIVDTNTWNPTYRMIPYRSMNMQYDRVAGQYLSKESVEHYMVDVPTFVRINYELIIWTDLVEQMNELVQRLMGITDHVWGDYHKFRTNIQSTTHDNVNVPGEDRLVKTTMSLQVDGHLRNEYEYHQSTIQKAYSIKRVDFLNETTDEVPFDDINSWQAPFPPTTDRIANDLDTTNLKRKIRQ